MGGNEHVSGLDARQIRAIPHLVASPSREAGCRAARISRSTLTRWLQSQGFSEALRFAEAEAFRGALRTIEGAVGKAAAAMLKLLGSRNESIRLRAAGELIEFALKAREMVEIEDRLRALEEAKGGR